MYTYLTFMRGQYNFFDHKNMKKTPSKVVGYLSKIKENFSTDLTAQTTQKAEPHITKCLLIEDWVLRLGLHLSTLSSRRPASRSCQSGNSPTPILGDCYTKLAIQTEKCCNLCLVFFFAHHSLKQGASHKLHSLFDFTPLFNLPIYVRY